MTPIYDRLVAQFGDPYKEIVNKSTPRQRRRATKKGKKLSRAFFP